MQDPLPQRWATHRSLALIDIPEHANVRRLLLELRFELSTRGSRTGNQFMLEVSTTALRSNPPPPRYRPRRDENPFSRPARPRRTCTPLGCLDTDPPPPGQSKHDRRPISDPCRHLPNPGTFDTSLQDQCRPPTPPDAALRAAATGSGLRNMRVRMLWWVDGEEREIITLGRGRPTFVMKNRLPCHQSYPPPHAPPCAYARCCIF